MTSYHDIQAARANLREIECAYLTERGWKQLTEGPLADRWGKPGLRGYMQRKDAVATQVRWDRRAMQKAIKEREHGS